MKPDMNRRKFVGATVASGLLTIVPRSVLGGSGHVAPSERITLAHIGMGAQGFNELGGLLKRPEIQIVAICDPNADSSDYVEWGKHSIRNKIRTYLGKPTWRENDDGCPGGRELGREVVDIYYAQQRAAASFKACRAYADFRELLDKEKDLDAVKIMTPDHLHANFGELSPLRPWPSGRTAASQLPSRHPLPVVSRRLPVAGRSPSPFPLRPSPFRSSAAHLPLAQFEVPNPSYYSYIYIPRLPTICNYPYV